MLYIICCDIPQKKKKQMSKNVFLIHNNTMLLKSIMYTYISTLNKEKKSVPSHRETNPF